MQKSKKVRMPAGIRNKLMAAVAMLLVSSIMMVSSTYAWFTLSTAPEVTGITTSVGANGNLEMALLNGQTFEKPADIKSTKSDSIAATGNVTVSNITWGNLVDLSDPAYGLNLIALNPAALNHPLNEDETTNTSLVSTDSLLLTAVYGSDGRVAELKNNTITGVYDSASGKWVGTQTFGEGDNATTRPAYGVRAIGVDSSMTTAEIYLNEAKTNVNAWSSVASATASAVGKHGTLFGTIAMGGSKTSYSTADLTALKDVALGVQSSLKSIVKVYSYAVLAAAASNEEVTEDVLVALYPQLINTTDAATLKNLMTTAGVVDDTYTARLGELETAQVDVATVLEHLDGDGEDDYVETSETTAVSAITDNVVTPLIGAKSGVFAFDADGKKVDISTTTDFSALLGVDAVYVTGGLLGEVAKDAGPYYMTEVSADIYGGEAVANAGTDAATKAELIESTGNLSEVATAVAAMDVETDDSTTTEKTIADFYGYILDFAFRTNASASKLQLQTTPTNRVYSDATGANLATQGAGSTATFAFDATKLNENQAKTLLEAVNLVFLDPGTGKVYATAELTNINAAASPATADVKLIGQDENPVAAIMDLPQNTATKLSVLVYLDGEEVDNGDVANAASSGMLNLNLQFSSSANLIPMQNTTLKNMVVTYTEWSDDDYTKAGLFTYNNIVYAVNDGYHIYKGSDGMTYFGKVADGATEPTEYTKLTAVTMAEALSSLKISFTADNNGIVQAGGTMDLTLTGAVANATVEEVTWTSGDTTVATVPTDDDKTDTAVVVTAGSSAGSTKITAAVKLAYAYKDESGTDQTYNKTVYASYTVTVTAAETQTPAAGAYTVTLNNQTSVKITLSSTITTVNGTEDYTFSLTTPNSENVETKISDNDYTVTYTVGDVTAQSITADENGTYTISKGNVTGDIVITVAAK